MANGGNKAFGDAILARVSEQSPSVVDQGPHNPARSILEQRNTALSGLASGKQLPDGNLLVDPARCRIWVHHNRDAAWLSEETCADLIENIKTEGRQRIPAIVRRVKDDSDYDYEVIAGRRRHWTVSWLRAHHYENIDFLITIQNLSDQEAFRVADLENRARKDISDIERARDYLFGLNAFYEGNQTVMAERLGVTKSWLSRYLDLAKLDAEIISAFASPYQIGVFHAAQIAPLLKKEATKPLLIEEARKLAAEQEGARATGRDLYPPKEIVRRLVSSTETKRPERKKEPINLLSAGGRPMMTITHDGAGGLRLRLIPKSGATRKELMEAFAKAISDL
ncbi:ParB/RepB/Spo0J family partition protein [Sphingomonas sp. 3-13AW]|uniref:ParB/RepB/Spo0J family partition protein n=1 Tax=Sphingomonas sp. 3-13AW TaxID=3050450 RepID=UPI003BB7EB8A